MYYLSISFPPITILKYSIMWKTRSIYDSVSIFSVAKALFYALCLYFNGGSMRESWGNKTKDLISTDL